eukprot:8325058-Heterocapsa_arctica.AAC.1
MMEEEPETMIEAEVEMPKENTEKSMMTEEEINNIADFVSENQKADLNHIEERTGRYRGQHRSQQGDDR